MAHPQEPPILDFSVFYGSDSQAKTKLVQTVRECCLKNGFFQITGHRVSRELQRRAMSWRRTLLRPPARGEIED